MASDTPGAITLNGEPTHTGRGFEPRVGAWWFEVEVSLEAVPSGAVTLSFEDGAVEFVGTADAARTVDDNGTISVRIEAGSGKLDEWLEPKHFERVEVKTLLQDVTSQTGDTLSDTIDSSLLSVRFDHWSRPRTIAHRFIQDVADELGVAWRVLRDGTIWLGAETWPEVKSEETERTKVAFENSVEIEPDGAPLILPGITYQDRKVAEVVTAWTHDGLAQTVVFEDRAPGRHTRSIQLDADWVTRQFGTQLDLSALYPCKIVGQSDDLLTVDLVPDDARIAGQGINKVAVRYGLPGVRAKVKSGARILLGFEAQDPKRPYASIWEHDSVEELQFAPDSNANIVIKATGSGAVKIESEGEISINSGNVKLGPSASSGIAVKGGIIAGMLPMLQAGPYPVMAVPAPGSIGFVGQIQAGSVSVKSG